MQNVFKLSWWTRHKTWRNGVGFYPKPPELYKHSKERCSGIFLDNKMRGKNDQHAYFQINP
jgi:hypothetical protein